MTLLIFKFFSIITTKIQKRNIFLTFKKNILLNIENISNKQLHFN